MFYLAHVTLRYVVLLLAVASAGYAGYGMAAGLEHDRLMRRLASWLSITLFAEVLVGFGLLFSARFEGALTAHVLCALGAAFSAQAPVSIMRRRRQEDRDFSLHLLGSSVALVLIVATVFARGAPLLGG